MLSCCGHHSIAHGAFKGKTAVSCATFKIEGGHAREHSALCWGCRETEVDWDQEIAADVKEECGKYGPVSHLWVDKASKGFIYAMFGTASGAGVAQKALHGRFFAGKQVLCGASLPACLPACPLCRASTCCSVLQRKPDFHALA